MLLIGATRVLLVGTLMGAGIVAPRAAADDVPATVRRVAATTALAAQEYRVGVRDGKVIAAGEVAEAKLFLTEALRAAALLPPPGGKETVAALDQIVGLVGKTASPDSIDVRVRALMLQLAATWQVSLDEVPAAAPSMARGREL